MPMPAHLLLNSFSPIDPLLYNTYEIATAETTADYPCPPSPPERLLMPPKSVTIFSAADTLDEDDDDDLPPLVEAPPTAYAEQEDANAEGGDAAGAIGGGGVQYTFASTITPSEFGASSSPAPAASPAPLQAGHAVDAPPPSGSSPTPLHATPAPPLYPPGLHVPHQQGQQFHQFSIYSPQSPTGAGTRIGFNFASGGGMGADGGTGVNIAGGNVEPPSPSNADVGSPSPPTAAPSPSFGGDSVTTTTTTTSATTTTETNTTSPSLSLALDEQREPASGPYRFGLQSHTQGAVQGGQGHAGGGGRAKPPRPPSYIPRPPNAFILFRASFVRSQRMDTQAQTAGAGSTGAKGVTTGGVSALGPGSVITIEPSSPADAVGKRGGKAGTAALGAPGGIAGMGAGGAGPTPSTSLSKLAGQLWRTLPPHERAIWENKARAAQAEHRAKYPDWRFRPENATGPGSGSTFWSGGGGGGTAMGSVPWSVSATGGANEGDWGGAVAAGKYRGGRDGGGGGGGGGEGSRRRKDRDRDKERDKEGGGKGKAKTGVGTNASTSRSAGTNPDASPGPPSGLGPGPGTEAEASPSPKSSTVPSTSTTVTTRGRARASRAAATTSTGAAARTSASQTQDALGLPSWAIKGLGIDQEENPSSNLRGNTTAIASPSRKKEEDTEQKNPSTSSAADIDSSTNADAQKTGTDAGVEKEAKREGESGTFDAGAASGRAALPQEMEVETQATQGSDSSRTTPQVREEQSLDTRNYRIERQETQNRADTSASRSQTRQPQEQSQGEMSREREREEGAGSAFDPTSDVRFAVPLTAIARRSVSVEAHQEEQSRSAERSGSRSAVPSPLPAPLTIEPAVPRDAITATAQSESQESTVSGAGRGQSVGLASEFGFGREFFAGPTSSSLQRRGSLVSLPGSGSASASGGSGSAGGSVAGSASGGEVAISPPISQHARAHSFSQPQTQTQTRARTTSGTQAPVRVQSQVPIPGSLSAGPTISQHRFLPSRGLSTPATAGGAVRTPRRNTVTAGSLPSASSVPVGSTSVRQFRPGFHGVGPLSPGARAGTTSYEFGPVYTGYERAYEVEQNSPPPLSPELSSPLSAPTASPTYAGHGSPPFVPFPAQGHASPPLYRPYAHPHPYAHARTHSFHQQILHHAHGQAQAQMQGQQQQASAISPMMLPMQTQGHAQSGATFTSPLSSPSFYSRPQPRARSHTGVGGSNVSASMDMDVDVASQHTSSSATTSGTSASGSSSSSTTVTSLFPPSSASMAVGGTVPPDSGSSSAGSAQVPHLSSYSSLMGWAGPTTPFTPGTGTSESPGVYETQAYAGGETTMSAFSSPTYAYPPYQPYSDAESGDDWFRYNYAGQVQAMGDASPVLGMSNTSEETHGIAFGPGPNVTPTPSPTEGTSASQEQQPQRQRQDFYLAQPQSQSQSQSTAAFTPPLSHDVAHSPPQFPFTGPASPRDSATSAFRGDFVSGYFAGHPTQAVSATGSGSSGEVAYVMDRYLSDPLSPGGMSGSPRHGTKERRK